MKPVPILFLLVSALVTACSPSGGDVAAPSASLEKEATDSPQAAAPETTETETVQATCDQDIGAQAARVLVGQCIQISPATHPPCNAQNSCDMIRDEIRRGCGFGDTINNPDFCSDYQ
ncbi:hypothetical protein [Hyphomonas oceanitis]|uniref:Lipoprotein n=1 Tax=Hyphomonas oceanitis SCH89 TaxID=1280953 RepID=A0A059GB32_9PROT|nr:hypothetical protein [Hyphomonas oceanitis]KDA04021.1 hypothetical protein HOC_01746 [Hyphomonas oceanitis SCH89]